jgi:hypothetical protein
MTFLYFIFFNCLSLMCQGVRTSTIAFPKVLSMSFDQEIFDEVISDELINTFDEVIDHFVDEF